MLNMKRLSVLAAVIFTIGLIGSVATYKSVPKADTVTEELGSTDFTNMEVNADDGEIIISSTNETKPKVEVTGYNIEENFSINIKNGTLHVNYHDKSKKFFSFGFNTRDVKIHLFIPENEYDVVKADANNGKVTTNGLHARELTLHADNGELDVKESDAKNMEVTSNNGQIKVDGVTGETVKLRADNGKIIFSHADIESSEISTSNGKIDLTEIAGTISAKANNGKIHFTTTTLTSPLDFITDNGKIHIETREKPTNAEIHAQVDNGSITLFGEKTSHSTYGKGENNINLRANNGKIIVEN
ncbi:DUF4097 family beta strand repeat-containing protein [Pseudogracilibacillus sp. ICA-222130]|uniref:DUF4097 family beta strand repeat-containing protein n=1 Tax=Pseudogracilibacillus sp. ICA-222130 TaxID=3134655 RepID=UPI0030C28337